MSRNKHSDDIITQRNQVKVGRRVLRGLEPVALVGPENKKDTLSASEFVEQLYGPGFQCVIIPPVHQKADRWSMVANDK